MSKWETRINKILNDEKQKHGAVYELNRQLYNFAHGFNPVDKILLLQELKKLCDNTSLIDSEIANVSMEPRYKQDEKECDQIITVTIKGDFNGYIKIETGSGYRNTNEGKLDIFYVWSSSNEIVSLKEEQCRKLYKQYKHNTVEKLIDLSFEKKYYLDYEDYFKNYEIWDKAPSEYGDSIKGELKMFEEHKNYKHYKSKYENLNKITKYQSVKEFAEEELNPYHESTTYEWIEYRL